MPTTARMPYGYTDASLSPEENALAWWVWILFLITTLLLANAIATCQEYYQTQRVFTKTNDLSRATKSGSTAGSTPIPVTILTGFLGSGKTTLINSILTRRDIGMKILVIENEIGAISIDHELLRQSDFGADSRSQSQIIVMKNGCLCCGGKNASSGGTLNELERILDHLLTAATSPNEQLSYSHVIIESSGLADPGPIIRTFLQMRSSIFTLDAVVTMIDTQDMVSRLLQSHDSASFPIEMQRQCFYADVMVLNKSDLVSPENQALVTQHLTRCSYGTPMTFVTSSSRDPVSLDKILNLQTFDPMKFHHTDFNDPMMMTSQHTANVMNVHFVIRANVHRQAFVAWMKQLVHQYGNRSRAKGRVGIFRLKGILAFESQDQVAVVQCVLDTFTIEPHASERWTSKVKRVCKIVIIGQALDRAECWEGFLTCFPLAIQHQYQRQTER